MTAILLSIPTSAFFAFLLVLLERRYNRKRAKNHILEYEREVSALHNPLQNLNSTDKKKVKENMLLRRLVAHQDLENDLSRIKPLTFLSMKEMEFIKHAVWRMFKVGAAYIGEVPIPKNRDGVPEINRHPETMRLRAKLESEGKPYVEMEDITGNFLLDTYYTHRVFPDWSYTDEEQERDRLLRTLSNYSWLPYKEHRPRVHDFAKDCTVINNIEEFKRKTKYKRPMYVLGRFGRPVLRPDVVRHCRPHFLRGGSYRILESERDELLIVKMRGPHRCQ